MDTICALIGPFEQEINTKRPHLNEKKVLHHRDSARLQNFADSMAKIVGLWFQLAPHPPFSVDLAPYSFF